MFGLFLVADSSRKFNADGHNESIRSDKKLCLEFEIQFVFIRTVRIFIVNSQKKQAIGKNRPHLKNNYNTYNEKQFK